ncbi:LLM class flavin-dependent oxidoreductase [Curtobacterium sp. S6]|uniref:LLM class flavin-dependent oxidoreductase n=1 Tax=Curtobacterium sp. S6 TaxID=1479623 RepID=UPI00068A2257|nr:LLM class flavin-dependent oxidoreductase [Curtobacterium sp. S6]
MAEHGISLLPDRQDGHGSAANYYDDVLAICRYADRLGLSHVKMTEHYMHEYGGFSPSPLTFLATVAAQTQRIRLMTGALIPAFHHPVQIAAHASMVDNLSRGRLDLGLGRAWLPYEFETFGVPMDQSRARYQATIEAVRDLWTQASATADTPFFAYRQVRSFPMPYQSPHPPLWGAAVRSPESFEWLARQGCGLMMSLPPARKDLKFSDGLVDVYREAYQEAHNGARGKVALSVPLMIADTDEHAYQKANYFHSRYMTVWSDAIECWSRTESADYPGYGDMAAHARELAHLGLREDGTAVVGSPQTVARTIRELQDRFSVDTFLWQVDFGGQDEGSMRDNLDRLVGDVFPLLDAAETRPGDEPEPERS